MLFVSDVQLFANYLILFDVLNQKNVRLNATKECVLAKVRFIKLKNTRFIIPPFQAFHFSFSSYPEQFSILFV